MALTIEITAKTSIPLELEGITPCRLRELDVSSIEKLEIYEGNQVAKLADFFQISGDAGDEEVRFVGDLSGVHWIGTKMSSGRLVIDGDVGRHLGSEMTGGEIEVKGNASDWVGAEMKGGRVHVKGRVGHLLGSAYRGSPAGMRGGTIIVNGDAGNEVGHSLRRGTLAVAGAVGDLAGFNMLAGTILIGGEGGIRHGAGMKRGTIAFLGKPPELLPTFTPGGRQQPTVMTLLSREMERLAFPKAAELLGEFTTYHGDQLEGGRGEILVRA